ncbi:DUF6043 family protein [Prevotella melaninogenica]|uniref:Uncharacterized protein n=1 Tax=Prevotella melaninogenica TaxID=28132 RepID=A0A250KI20_9BACT|nr:DUF6043 family protein [Prevotella melaninogenica]BBA29328.1 hypothetical protein PMEL1_01259 [Prevotella melaninogenica]
MKGSFEDFKQLIKEWLDAHPKEYGSFVEEMNRTNSAGFQKVFMLVVRLVPKYKDAVKKRMSDDTLKDFSSLESILTNSNLAENLVNEFQNTDKHSIVPAMLAWLYYGRSYECMVEQGESLIHNSKTNRVHRWILSLLVKYIIHKSISSGERTKEDWEEFRLYKHSLSTDTVIESTLEKAITFGDNKNTGTNKKRGRPKDERNLKELLKPGANEELLSKIRDRILTKPKEKDIVYLKIALEEEGLLYECNIAPFYRALSEHYNIRLIGLRGVQDAYKELTETIGKTGIRLMDKGKDRASIDEFKTFLS